MDVLITGGAGFVGSHLVSALLHERNRVIIVDDFSSGNLKHIKEVGYEAIVGDISRREAWSRLPSNIDSIVALACFPRSTSLENPLRDLEVNYKTTLFGLEYAKRIGAAFLFASNTGIVSNPTSLPVNETAKDAPTTPYDNHKLASEHMLNIYRQQYDVRTLVFRFASVYGPGQTCHERINWHPLIPHFTRLMKHGEVGTIDGDGLQTRDFIHVTDIVSGLVLGLEKVHNHLDAEKIILGTNTQTSILSLYQKLKELTGYNGQFKFGDPRKADIRAMQYDNSLAKNILGWQPNMGLDDGLRETVNWLLEVSE